MKRCTLIIALIVATAIGFIIGQMERESVQAGPQFAGWEGEFIKRWIVERPDPMPKAWLQDYLTDCCQKFPDEMGAYLAETMTANEAGVSWLKGLDANVRRYVKSRWAQSMSDSQIKSAIVAADPEYGEKPEDALADKVTAPTDEVKMINVEKIEDIGVFE